MPNSARLASSVASQEPWLRMKAFGRPVVPEVKPTRNGVFGSTAGMLQPAGCAAIQAAAVSVVRFRSGWKVSSAAAVCAALHFGSNSPTMPPAATMPKNRAGSSARLPRLSATRGGAPSFRMAATPHPARRACSSRAA